MDTEFTNTLSKNSVLEDLDLSIASLREAADRENTCPITNESIREGDILLETYQVSSPAIPGGMGNVWRVRHTGWDADLAMKRPKPAFFAEGGANTRRQFIQECRYWIDLGLHPNIVSCYYVREIGGTPTIFSEWMDGGSVKDRIKDESLYHGSMREVTERILGIAIQTERGLQYAHKNGLIHRDIKPGNILLTGRWNAKVADFGLASLNDMKTDGETAERSIGYTIAYSPAEQKRGEKAAVWMDVYAWALTVLRMFAGEPAWESSEEAAGNLEKYFSESRVPVPGPVRDMISRCLCDRSFGFDLAETILTDTYRELIRAEYPEPAADAARDTADSLNNRALSFLDLGMEEKADQCWSAALAQDPSHYPSRYNQILLQWNLGKISDEKAEREVEQISQNDLSEQKLLGFARLHIARADVRAVSCIQKLKENGYDRNEISRLEERAAKVCREPEKIMTVSEEMPLTADEDGNIGWVDIEEGNELEFRNMETGKTVYVYDHPFPIQRAVFSETGEYLAISGEGTQYWKYRTHQYAAGYRDAAASFMEKLTGVSVSVVPKEKKLPAYITEQRFGLDEPEDIVLFREDSGVFRKNLLAGEKSDIENRDCDGVRYILEKTGKTLKTVSKIGESWDFRMLNTELALVFPGYEEEHEEAAIYRIAVPDPAFQAEYLLCRIETTEERISLETVQHQMLEEAKNRIREGQWMKAVAITDDILSKPDAAYYPDAMSLRRAAGSHCSTAGIKRVLRISADAEKEWCEVGFAGVEKETEEQVISLCGSDFANHCPHSGEDPGVRTKSDFSVFRTAVRDRYICFGKETSLLPHPADWRDDLALESYESAVVDLRTGKAEVFYEGESAKGSWGTAGMQEACGCLSGDGAYLLTATQGRNVISVYDLKDKSKKTISVKSMPRQFVLTSQADYLFVVFARMLAVLDISNARLVWQEETEGQAGSIRTANGGDTLCYDRDHAYEILWEYESGREPSGREHKDEQGMAGSLEKKKGFFGRLFRKADKGERK